MEDKNKKKECPRPKPKVDKEALNASKDLKERQLKNKERVRK